jgi:prefoldin subunit 5
MAQVIAPHPRNLPTVLFIEDEEAFLQKTGMTEEQAALEMRSAFQRLRQLSESLAARRESLEETLPKTAANKAMVQLLVAQHAKGADTRTQYELIGGVYARARVPPSGKVALWLGANVMVEYPLDEAEVFLARTEKEAREALEQCVEDLRHLSDQSNTLEVNINRMHNHALSRRRARAVQQQTQQLQQAAQQMAQAEGN